MTLHSVQLWNDTTTSPWLQITVPTLPYFHLPLEAAGQNFLLHNICAFPHQQPLGVATLTIPTILLLLHNICVLSYHHWLGVATIILTILPLFHNIRVSIPPTIRSSYNHHSNHSDHSIISVFPYYHDGPPTHHSNHSATTVQYLCVSIPATMRPSSIKTWTWDL